MNNGKERALPGEKFYIPGSIMEMSVDNDDPAAWGMNKKVDVYFDNSPVFKVAPEAIAKNEITNAINLFFIFMIFFVFNY